MSEQASNRKVIALVTGASSGLGAEFCRQLADRCDVIIAVARREERLTDIAKELEGTVEVHCLAADLGTVEGVAKTMETLRQKGPVDYLVNNAGFSTFGFFPDLPIEGQREMVDVHIDASITLSRAAVPFMKELGGGTIINVSSLATFVPGKGLAVYGATKAFLNYFSIALQAELAGTDIEVQALCPGYTHSEFHAEMVEGGFSKDRIPAEMWMTPDEVVSTSLAALGGGKVLVVPGEGNQAMARMGLEQQLAQLQ
ncbi:MAG: short-subunit dehydrogenase [Halioglobus sp.]|jgi:short-subunit dehydrogenase